MVVAFKTNAIANARKELGMDWPLAVFDRDAPNELREYIVSTPELDLAAIIPPKASRSCGSISPARSSLLLHWNLCKTWSPKVVFVS
jgi:hypothetical protein